MKTNTLSEPIDKYEMVEICVENQIPIMSTETFISLAIRVRQARVIEGCETLDELISKHIKPFLNTPFGKKTLSECKQITR